MAEPEPFYDDESGELLGYTEVQDDGLVVAWDESGELVGASDGASWWEASELETDDTGEDYGYDPGDEREQRLAALEEYAATPREPAYYPVQTRRSEGEIAEDYEHG